MKENLEWLKDMLLNNKSSKQTVIKNTIRLWIGEFFVKWWYIIATFFLARYLWTSWYWSYSYYLYLTWFFIFFADFWIATRITYYISKNTINFQMLLPKLFKLKLILWVWTLLILSLYLSTTFWNSQTIWLLFWVYVILKSYNELQYWYFRSLEHVQYEVICKVLWMMIFVVGIRAVINQSLWLLEIAWLLSIRQFTSFLCWYHFIKKTWISQTLHPIKITNARILKESLPYAIMILWWLLYFSIDIIMIRHFLWEIETGLYSAAVSLYQAYYLPASLVALVLLPRITKLWEKSKHIFKKWILIFLWVWVLWMIFNMLLWKHIVLVTFGTEFIQSVSYLLILWYLIPARYISYYLWTQITGSWLQTKRSIVIILCAIINIIINLYTIPKYWVMWAIYATMITELIVLWWYIYINNKLFN